MERNRYISLQNSISVYSRIALRIFDIVGYACIFELGI